MKKLLQTIAASLAVATITSANALTLTPADAVASGTEQGVPSILIEIAGLGFTLGPEIYKSDVPNSEGGTFNSSYNTAYLNSPTDPKDAVISYVSGQPVINTTQATYLLVKDGNQDPAWYLFNLTSPVWNGTATINLNDFWPGNGAISHVSIYGSTTPGGGDTHVPDGGTTLALLGLGLTGLGMARIRFARK